MNPLTDVLPEKARKYLYAALFVASLIFTAVQAAHGNWFEAISGVVTALFGATAASNTAVSSNE